MESNYEGARVMHVFKPRISAWLALLVIMAPVFVIAVLVLAENPSDWPLSAGLVVLGAGVVAYNATARLVLTDQEIRFKRFGRLVWLAPIDGTTMSEGFGGQPAVLPAYVFSRDGEAVGYVLKLWFNKSAIAQLRQSLNG